MALARRCGFRHLMTFVVCASAVLLLTPSSGLAANWAGTTEPVPGSAGASSVATGLDGASNLTAVWSDADGVQSSLRSSNTKAWSAAVTLSGSDTGATAADVAVASDGQAVATWIGGDTFAYAAVRAATGGTWSAPTQISSTAGASSPQAAIVGGLPRVYWLVGSVIESASASSGGIWALPGATPSGAVPAPGAISKLRVALASDGSGVAAWVRDSTVDAAVIAPNGSWAASAPLFTAPASIGSVAVAAGGGSTAVGWSDPSAGVQVAVLAGSSFAIESNAAVAGATEPSLAVDSNGRVFATMLGGSSVSARIRTGANAWTTPVTIGSGAATTTSASDPAGDVAAAWPAASAVQVRVYDASPPVPVITTPGSPLPPGVHQWSVTASDVWSSVNLANASWLFSPGGANSGPSPQDAENNPGPVHASVTVADAAGNSATAQASITISPQAPTNDTRPSIVGGSSPTDGQTLTVGPGSWTANPTATLGEQWQRCSSQQACQPVTANANGSYTLTAADVGKRMRLEETASNTAGSATADSDETPVVKPRSTVSPALALSSDPIADGVVLTASPGGWDGATGLTFSYRFLSCDQTCVTVLTGPSNQYTVHPADVGSSMQVQVTAVAGPVDSFSSQATATSTQSDVVAPLSSVAPTLSGGTQDTQQLTVSSQASSWDSATGLAFTYAFSRCDAGGSSCVVVQTGGQSYTLHAADMGSRIKAQVLATASDSMGNTSSQTSSAFTALTAVVSPHLHAGAHVAAPTPMAPATLVQDGVTLTATPATWDDPGTLAFTYQYYQCKTPATCTAVSSPSASNAYLLQPTDVGLPIEVAVTASANGASTTVISDATVPVQPLNDGNASIGVPAVQQDGQTFTASDGSWDGATELDISYQWKRCNVAQVCSPIPSATDKTYTAGVADVGQTLRVAVAASKGGSALTHAAGDSSPTAAIAPLSTTAPSLSGAPADTKPLLATDGAWDGATGLTETFQFLRCDASGAACTTVLQSGGSATYTLALADIGSTIRVIVFAKMNASATVASITSSNTAVITPLSIAAPAAPGGTLQDGQQLTAANGTWADQGGLSFSYQWSRCTPGCNPIAGATSQVYTLQAADVGSKVLAIVTAFVGAGAATSPSPQTAAVAPLSTVPSSVSTPLAQDGQLFSASPGEWDGAAGLTFSYQWKRCGTDGGTCTSLANSGSTYTAGPADVGSTLRASVSASKGGSSASPAIADSDATPVVAARNSVRPAITGDPTDGQTLTTPASTNAAWDNTAATLAFSYQWLRCDTAGGSCVPITGATNSTYTLIADDVAAGGDPAHQRHTVEVQVTATVNGATTTATSDATGTVAPQTTTITTLPRVNGGAYSHQTLNVGAGSYTGTGLSYLSYQWVSCDPPLATPSCTNLGPASITATTYQVQDADVGHYVSVIESVVNRLGDVKTTRAAFGVPVLQNPFGVVDVDGSPVVTGAYVDGRVLSTTSGIWTQPTDVSFSYQWLRCAPLPSGASPIGSSTCPAIHGATTSTYTLTADDVGRYIVSRVRGDYAPIPAYAYFDSDIEGLPAVGAAPPVNAARPTIPGSPVQNTPLTASAGSWSGTNTAAVPMTFTYQWSRCDSDGVTCQTISGATHGSYTPTAQDVGLRLVVRVTATNPGGSQSAISDATDLVAGPVLPTQPVVPPASTAVDATAPPRAVAAKADRTAPRLTLTFLGAGTLLGGTTLRLNATCPKTETSCKARFQLTAVLRKPTGKAVVKPTVIAASVTTLKGGQKALLKLKLSAGARAALKRKHTLKVTLLASVVDAAGNVTPRESKGTTLRWKKG